MKGSFYLSTDMVESAVRDDFWRETSSLIYEVTPEENSVAGLSGTVRSRLLGNLVLGNTSFNTQFCRRSRSLITRTDLDFYLLQLVLAGEYRGDFAGKDFHARPGDMFIMDLTKPLNSKKEAGARLTIVIPRKDFGQSLASKNLHGVILPGHVAVNRLLFDFVLSLDGQLENLEDHVMPGVQESLMLLLRTSLSGATLTHEQFMSISLSLRKRVIDYIDQNLCSPDLGPQSIMAHFRLSHSHLYRAFEPDKGVAKLIRDKRLDMAYRLILNKRGHKLSLKELAYDCGFPSRAQFSRFFQERFGIAPKALRGLQEAVPQGSDSSILFHEYLAARIPSAADPG